MSVVSYSESSSDSQDGRWDDWEDDEVSVPMKCLFCAQTFDSAAVLFQHAKQAHGFDFLNTRAALNLDFYQSMRVVNYIRTLSLKDPQFSATTNFSIDGTEAFLADDAYLKPAIADDSLLYALDELDLDDESSRQENLARTANAGESAALQEQKLTARIQALEQQLIQREWEAKHVSQQFEEYREMVKRQFYDSVETTAAPVSEAAETFAEADGSDYYFNSYAGNDIHMQMLQDKVRTEGYRDFIYDNRDIFQGKVVLDVGCGTGILSMFAARAGAAKVIAVDNSDIIHKARANVIENGLDNVITLVKGRIEELELPVKQVDIIISEWMGYFLLFEAMLDSVLVARDKYLAPGGLLAPSASYIYLTAISDQEYMNERANYWDDVYGFKMSAMKERGPVKEADVDVVPSSAVVATRALISEIDHGTATPATLDFTSSFTLQATQDATVHALLGYFDVAFSRVQATCGPSREELAQPVYTSDGSGAVAPKALWKQPESSMHGFTTGPHGTPTHWKQTVFVLKDPIAVAAGDKLHGQFVCRKSTSNPRELDLEITYFHVPAALKNQIDDARQHAVSQKYQLR
ncbi:S-adenosyl-L-methionine-dependent methyltransferase [Coemansia mojavensis]|nr:S-adenosyl-L-methionine-dependent methyltransferase [Coemansia mojavensis]